MPALLCAGCWLRGAAELPAPLDHTPLRDVRVRLSADMSKLRVRCDGPIDLLPAAGGDPVGQWSDPEWAVVETTIAGTVSVAGDDSEVGSLLLRSPEGRNLFVSYPKDGSWTLPKVYAGGLQVRANATGGLAVINLVDVETYVGCVVAGEIGSGFETEAFHAQAVVSRGYVLFAMLEAQQSGAAYDVTAGEGSQVYEGLRGDSVGRKAREAADYTRGIVCTWLDGDRPRLFSTFYSSVCGGVSQSARIFGQAGEVPPLAGGVACEYCQIAPKGTYRWGPVTMSLVDAQAKLTSRDSRVGDIGALTDIEVAERAAGERPARMRLIGSSGKTVEMSAENFRLALGGRQLKSTHFDLTVKGSTIVFENGRGFGHGLGLCQWGMEGQAREGKRAGAILAYYFPGTKLVKAY